MFPKNTDNRISSKEQEYKNKASTLKGFAKSQGLRVTTSINIDGDTIVVKILKKKETKPKFIPGGNSLKYSKNSTVLNLKENKKSNGRKLGTIIIDEFSMPDVSKLYPNWASLSGGDFDGDFIDDVQLFNFGRSTSQVLHKIVIQNVSELKRKKILSMFKSRIMELSIEGVI